jgi:hypothetical protein
VAKIATPSQERRTALFVIAVAFMVMMGLFSRATRTAQLVFVVGPAVIGAIVSLLVPIPHAAARAPAAPPKRGRLGDDPLARLVTHVQASAGRAITVAINALTYTVHRLRRPRPW